MESLSALLSRYDNVSLEEFIAAEPWPVLVGGPLPKNLIEPRSTRSTVRISYEEISSDPLVWFLRSPGANVIYLGRDDDNDIVLPALDISKQHAAISVDSEKASIRDCCSTNGVFLSSTRIKPNIEVPLSNAQSITLGESTSLTFFTPEGFYAYMTMLRIKRSMSGE